DDTRPTVIIAYTIKGRGLPTQGHPQNHSSLLTVEQYEQLAAELGMDPNNPWARFATDSTAGRVCAASAEWLSRDPVELTTPPPVPADIGRTPSGTSTTQAALGRVLLDLSRQAPDAAKRVVTVSPDVSSTTNLAGWLNKVGVWSPNERRNWFDDDAETIMHWREKPTGQHMELGI
ncbi:pyruvate dehydrogenase, partial [Rhodococcus sp. T2V]|nr:pyruvate dehydrogenase [Rhodococcus sp. T2V]